MKRASFYHPAKLAGAVLAFAVGAAFAPALSYAEPVRIVPEAAEDENALTLVSAPSAIAGAVSDLHRLLIIGDREGQLLVFPLGLDGSIEHARSTTVNLPQTANAGAGRPFSLLFHPRLPLLYVWQNLGNDAKPQAREALPHLLIYRCDGQRLALLSAFVQGRDFALENQRGMLAIDDKQSRLFIPSGSGGAKKSAASLAYYPLTPQGLPVVAAGTQTPESVSVSHSINSYNSLVPGPGGRSAIIGIIRGALFVDFDSRQVARQTLLSDSGSIQEVATHPRLPLYYFAAFHGNTLLAIEHVEGVLTQLPRSVAVEGARFRGRPVVMSARSQVALGGQRSVFIVDLDKEGWPAGKAREFKPTKFEGETVPLVYSEKFNRLYVPVK